MFKVVLVLLMVCGLVGCAPVRHSQAAVGLVVQKSSVTPASVTVTVTASSTVPAVVESATPSPTPATCVVSTGLARGTVNVRAGAGMSYTVLWVANEGDSLYLLDAQRVDGWLHIRNSDQKTGWFYSDWCGEW
jgi:uncharacterized protein YgiM (DUF1202 family)